MRMGIIGQKRVPRLDPVTMHKRVKSSSHSASAGPSVHQPIYVLFGRLMGQLHFHLGKSHMSKYVLPYIGFTRGTLLKRPTF